MGNISKHFNREDFSCSCGCGFNAVDFKLLEWLEAIREKFGVVIVHCACRCLDKNRSIGSKDTSQHVKGMAVDFHIKGKEAYDGDVVLFLNKLVGDTGGVGFYEWGFHIDCRGIKVRW